MIIAKTEKMFYFLKNQFQERTVIKKYYTLVYGIFDKSEDNIEFPIERSKRTGRMVAKPKGESERNAFTHFVVKNQFQQYTFLDVEIKTGRSHQIRAHMHAIDHPIIGDDLYKSRKYKDRFNLDRVFLHSYYFEFSDLNNERKVFEVKLPKELDLVLKGLK